jgi:hypothetical protein
MVEGADDARRQIRVQKRLLRGDVVAEGSLDGSDEALEVENR